MSDQQIPLVSILCATYNHEKYIKETIEGFLIQKTTFPFEIIIHDDASTDATVQIVKSFEFENPNLFHNIYQEENQFSKDISSITRIMIQASKGKYIAFCEGDDYWTEPLKLQKQVDFLEANPDFVLCFHQVNILKTDGSIVEDFITKVPENCETIQTLARFGNYIHTPSVVFRNVLPTLPFELGLSPIGDYFMYMMLAEHGKLKFIDEKMAIYRHGVGILSGNDDVLKLKKWIDCLVLIFSNSKNEEIKRILYERYQTCVNEMYRMTLRVDNENNFSLIKKKLKNIKNKIYKRK